MENLDTAHTYNVHIYKNGDAIDINIMVENMEDANNILGFYLIDISENN